MTPEELTAAGVKLYGRKGWKKKLSRDLGLNYSTIHRMLVSGRIPGPVQAAVRSWLAAWQRQYDRKYALRPPPLTTGTDQGVKP